MLSKITDALTMKRVKEAYSTALDYNSRRPIPKEAIGNAKEAQRLLFRLSDSGRLTYQWILWRCRFWCFEGIAILDGEEKLTEDEWEDGTLALEKALESSVDLKGTEAKALEAYCAIELGIRYSESKFGSRAENLERSIELTTKAKPYYTTNYDFENLVLASVNLANFYRVRQIGTSATNLEMGLSEIDKAIHIIQTENVPHDLAGVLVVKGELLLSRHSSDSEHIEEALHIAEEVITKLIDKSNPKYSFHPTYRFALTLKAKALLERRTGSFKANIWKALEIFQETHDFFETSSIPNLRIRSKIDFARALLSSDFLFGPTAIEKSILCLEHANSMCGSDNKQEYGEIMYLMGLANSKRGYGRPSQNRIITTSALNLAIDHLDPELDLDLWVKAHVALVRSLIDCGIDAESLVDAVVGVGLIDDLSPVLLSHLKDAGSCETLLHLLEKIESRTTEGSTDEIHALVSQCKALIKRQEYLCKPGVDIDAVAESYNQAIDLADQFGDPLLLVQSYIELAEFHFKEHPLSSTAHELSAELFKRAQSVLSLESFPQAYLSVNVSMASLLALQGKMTQADQIFKSVIEHFSQEPGFNFSLFSCANSEGLSLAPLAAIASGDLERAVSYQERIRASKLSGAISLKQYVDSQVNDESLNDRLRNRNLSERLLGSGIEENKFALISAIERAESKFADITKAELLDYCRNFRSWVLLPVIGTSTSKFVLIPPSCGLESAIVSELLPLGRNDFSGVVVRKEEGWIEVIKRMNTKSFSHDDWFDISDKVSNFLWEFLGAWTVAEIENYKSANSSELVIILDSFLYFLPIGLAKNPDTARYLCDDYVISYSPSLSALSVLQERAKKHQSANSNSISYIPPPIKSDEKELKYAFLETEISLSCFDDDNASFVPREKVTLDNVMESVEFKNYWHFATHGQFDWSDSSNSFIELDRNFHADHLFILDSKTSLRMVVLSACESGVHDLQNNINEASGLSSVFLELGAIGVISTLWKIEDISSLIISRFYELHIQEKLLPAKALQTAQLWFRDITVQELRNYIQERLDRGAISNRAADILLEDNELSRLQPNEKIFEDPYYWAAFVLHGC